jgi:hypothetical protein
MSIHNVTLSSSSICIRFLEGGGLAGLTDLKTGRNYIAHSAGAKLPLFRLTCSEMRDGAVLPGELKFSSLLAREISCQKTDKEVRFLFSNIDGMDFNAECTVKLEENPALSDWRINISNNTRYAIRSVEYPVVQAVMQLGDSMDDDRILLPKQDGYLLGNPARMEWEGDRPDRRYNQRYDYPGDGREFPAGISAQLLAYYDEGGGMYLGTHDGGGHAKMLGPVWLKDGPEEALDFTPVHSIPEAPGNDYLSPYDTVIGCFYGDWQAAADIYKSWAKEQEWCGKKLVERKDIPDWIKQGAFFFNFRLRYQEGEEAFLDRVPEYVNRWGKELGIPMVAMMCGWEKIGEWAGPDYFPPYGGDERFRKLCAGLKKSGIRPFPFGLSGLKLPVRKKIGRDWPQPELEIDYDNRACFEEHYRRFAAVGPDGKIILDSEVASWDGLHAYACVATPQARKQLHDATLKLVEDFGVQVSQMDQVFNGGSTECYAPAHGHPLGRGKWQVEEMRKIYSDTRSHAKELDPEFVLSQEFQSELFIPFLDIYHGRNYDQPRGLVGVPLFSYLYHEYIPCYGGDWSSFLSDNTSGVYYHAANFVYGNLPAGCPQTMWKMTRNVETGEADPRIMKMAVNACTLFQGFQQYLVLGEMLHTAPLPVPEVKVNFCGLNFSGWKKREMPMPSILHCVWKSPEGRIAYALANISDEPQTFLLEVPRHEIRGKATLLFYRNALCSSIIREDVNLPQCATIELLPQDAAILEIIEE